MEEKKRLLVVSAHAADYVWRAGGTIAHYIQKGAPVRVIVLSLGVRGESNHLWKTPGVTPQEVADIRRRETFAAAKALGIQNLQCWELEDYPLRATPELESRLVEELRRFRPDILLSHDRFDILNPDHNQVSELVFRCSVISNSAGVQVGDTAATRQMGIFGFEPHQTELSRYRPGCFINITDSFPQKKAAMACFQAQSHLIQYYTDRAAMRGNHARRLSGSGAIAYAESFSAFFPYAGDGFVV